ncbi:MAG: TonB-dependent receptor [Saprospiraceae bacterium]|nr:TonB-dependent receptor [Saprospiraceae bacterium]
MKKGLFFIAFCLGLASLVQGQRTIGKGDRGQGPFNIKMKILDRENGDPLIGANIYIPKNGMGAATDINGLTEFSLNRGVYVLEISYLGYESIEEKIQVRGRGEIVFDLISSAQLIDEIIVSSEAVDRNVKSAELGKQVMTISTIESLPPFVGEVDILKSITLLPGVSSVGEASAGFNVRGSNYDQNLILLGGAPLYNPSHLFGFFSAFNTELIQDISIYKGGIPANYGGRASSIVDLRFKRGSQEKWEGKASLGLISAKVSAGGPVFTKKLTAMVAGRTSYSNYILNAVDDANIKNSSANFYDVNAILDFDITENTSVRYSFYRSADKFQLASDTSFAWSNQNHSLSLRKNFGQKFLIDLTAVDANYKFSILDDGRFSAFNLDSDIRDQGLNLGFKWFIGEKQDLSFGAQTKLLTLNSGSLTPDGPDSSIVPFSVAEEKAQESGVYIQHNVEIGKWLGLSYGLRYNQYRFLGPGKVPNYLPLLPRAAENISSFTEFGDGDVIEQYEGFEPRASIRFSFDENTSLKLGYNRMFQYIHLISNTTTIAPTDTWKLSDSYLKPQEVVQYSGGLFRNWFDNSLETSVEVFYKDLKNILDYKDGATLLLNPNLESDLLNGEGEAYGIEVYLEKKKGDLTGWISYTYALSQRRVIGSYPEETINNGDWYSSNYEKPHILSVVGDYKISDRVKASAIFTYSTGRPASYPTAKFNYFNGTNIGLYDQRNGFRVPDYHRLDLSLTFNLFTPYDILNGDFVLSMYNVYGRRNAFSVFFDDIVGAPPQAFRLSILGIPFPSLSYKFDF